MSDATNERPGEGTHDKRFSGVFGGKTGCVACMCEAAWEENDEAAELIAELRAACHKWSENFARQADELVAAKDRLEDAELSAKHWGGVAKANAEARETLTARLATLFDALAHGDDEHRAWLRKAIDDHFAGRPVDAATGKGSGEIIAGLNARLAEVEGHKQQLRVVAVTAIKAGEKFISTGVELEAKLQAAETRVKELESDLKWIADVTPIKGLYHGGETYAGLNQRIQQQAKKSLERVSTTPPAAGESDS